jgi:hypothetical protein
MDTRYWWLKLTGSGNLEDIGLGGRVVLFESEYLRNCMVERGTDIWLRLGTSGSLLRGQ